MIVGGSNNGRTSWRNAEGRSINDLEVVAIGSKIQSQVQSELDKGQREYFLRQQLKAIREELGEADEVQAEVNELRDQLAAIELPEGVRKQVDRELARLEEANSTLFEKLQSRKLVERAKGIVQRDLGLSEEQAYLALQRQSRQKRRPMKEIAEAIILSDEVKGNSQLT